MMCAPPSFATGDVRFRADFARHLVEAASDLMIIDMESNQ
jgi:hypothetical protein